MLTAPCKLACHTQPEPRSLSALDLVLPFKRAEKPHEKHRVGIESEKFGFVLSNLSALPYEGAVSIVRLFEIFAARGWVPVREYLGGPVVALRRAQTSITLEPGAQLELSGAPFPDLHGAAAEIREHHRELKEISDALGIGWSSVGFHPLARTGELPWVPKRRYAIMREYLPTKGSGAIDMMQRTATIQVNLDYADEADAMHKLRVLLRLAPLMHAITAHAPLQEGEFAAGQSVRGDVWQRMDPSRSGLIDRLWALPRPRYEDYVSWALSAGMFLFKRGETVIANTGQTFRSLLEDGFGGHRATEEDWLLHLGTLFPEVRLKNTLEIRCCDAQPEDTFMAVPAMVVGLACDGVALEQATELALAFQLDEIKAKRPQMVLDPFSVTLGGKPLRAWGERLLEIADFGLARRRRVNQTREDERKYLEPLVSLFGAGQTPGSRLRQKLESGGPLSAESIVEATRLF